MNDPSLEPTHTATPAGQAIYDVDVPCPQCEYNLRGLTQPRCPECGQMFDPLEVLAWNKERMRKPPSFWRVSANMFPHPIAFWRMPLVRRGNGLPLQHLILMLAIAGAAWSLVAGSMAIPVVLVTMVLGLAVLDLHLLLCWLMLWLVGTRSAFRNAYTLVSYAALWGVPATAGLAATSITHRHAYAGLSVLGFWATTIFCLLWTIALYEGVRKMARAGRIAAIWCITTNPFWYVAGMVLWSRAMAAVQ